MHLIIVSLLTSFLVSAESPSEAIRRDIDLILEKAKLPKATIQYDFKTGTKNEVRFTCNKNQVFIKVVSRPSESVATLYYGIHKLGFLFPHPRMQINPGFDRMRRQCGKSFDFEPAFHYRGFHLHTQYPNEWVRGFFEGDRAVAEDLVRWLARNFQNILQIQMIRTTSSIGPDIEPAMTLAHNFNMRVGLSVSFATFQQKSYNLLPFWSALLGLRDEYLIEDALDTLLQDIPYDYIAAETGTAFTNFGYKKTLDWLHAAANSLKSKNKFLMAKVHSTVDRHDRELGNYNFLPQHADGAVGALAHTVYFYGLNDKSTPIYGRQSFADLARFIRQEKMKRNVWYYPETSYFMGMDIDVPLFLTDYLRARTDDMVLVAAEGVKGHVNFSSGQELGHWLFDWNVALQANKEYSGDPLITIKLLGEDENLWRKILDFQTDFFKERQVIRSLTSSNLLDELPFNSPIHERILARDFWKSENALRKEVMELEFALKAHPFVNAVKHPELKGMLQVTHLRLQHALYLRKAALDKKDETKYQTWMAQARRCRESALAIMGGLIAENERYPEAKIFDENENPTSYDFGYGWTAKTLHFWEREERIVKEGRVSPFFMNIYNPLDMLL